MRLHYNNNKNIILFSPILEEIHRRNYFFPSSIMAYYYREAKQSLNATATRVLNLTENRCLQIIE